MVWLLGQETPWEEPSFCLHGVYLRREDALTDLRVGHLGEDLFATVRWARFTETHWEATTATGEHFWLVGATVHAQAGEAWTPLTRHESPQGGTP